jgi:hypothetical protein
MKYYKAIIKEVGMRPEAIGNTKIGTYKGLSKEAFIEALEKNTCFTFEIVEIC